MTVAQLKEQLKKWFYTQENKVILVECLSKIVHKQDQQTSNMDMTKIRLMKDVIICGFRWYCSTNI